jgi:hypothetical protein
MSNKSDVQAHEHQRIEVRSVCSECGQELGRHTFNRADIENQQLTEMPDRDAMSLINLNAAVPVNLALAANVLSDGSVAQALAAQYTPITQAT